MNVLAFIICLDCIRSNRKEVLLLTSLLANLILLEIVIRPLHISFYKNNYFLYNIIIIETIFHYVLIFSNRKKNVFYLLFWVFLYIASFIIFGLHNRVFIELYIGGLIFVSILIFRYFNKTIFSTDSFFVWNDSKAYLGIGILLFFTCSFPLLLLFDSLTSLGGAYLVFYRLLQIGNVILSTSYVLMAILEWKKA